MTKIKIVQIVSIGDDFPNYYLDDKGRVWFQEVKKYGEYPAIPEYVTTWKQLGLPDEPTNT